MAEGARGETADPIRRRRDYAPCRARGDGGAAGGGEEEPRLYPELRENSRTNFQQLRGFSLAR